MKCAELYRILTKDGWYPVSQKGSHVKLKHEVKKRNNNFPESWESRNGQRIGEKDFKGRRD